MVIKEYYLYNNELGEKEFKISNSTALIKIEVPSEVNITAQVKLSKDSKNYNGIMGIKSNDLKTYIIMTDGLFTIDVNGIYSIKFNSDVKNYIKAKEIG